jgi:alpha-beta hydrolase superfamily lysophospholipase
MANLLWLSTSPSLKWLDTPLLAQLAKGHILHLWEYEQSLDEAVSLDEAIHLLHDYFIQRLKHLGSQMSLCSPRSSATLDQRDQHSHGSQERLHLIAHGISGVLGLLFARQYPEFVESLTLLAVGVHPAITWHAHYYTQRNLFEWSQQQTLLHMAYQLFRTTMPCSPHMLAEVLEIDLTRSPCPHSLLKMTAIAQGGIEVPLLVCGGQLDTIVDIDSIYDWHDWMKPMDAVWICPEGRHFFHYQFPEQTCGVLQSFWQKRASQEFQTAHGLQRSIEHATT